ncbi:hypothetical protein GCM10027275_07920 [Rhabdobacter roseus]|uniref:Signal transduction histidine kinase n=1 Tax=Rhabdobacter roseus TaxID=1655419 RepID=A0A840TMB1_9BACT|nr:histidine kinase [Rhabdobacter roseus]MBB5282692.1 signal transduction histidine kinase [Rhabdobacter roseus]
MEQLDRQVARRLTRFYVLALSLVALLTISGIVLVKRTLRDLHDDGRVLNVAGRQRMLSQRLTKLAVLRAEGIPSSDPDDFRTLLRTWANNQEQLQQGRLRMEKEYVVRKSGQLDSMFLALNPVFRSLYTGFLTIYDPQHTAADRSEALRVVLRQEPDYLARMDNIVFRYDAESLARVQYLQRTEWLLGFVTLLVLVVEGVLIFRPVVNYTQQVIRMLTESEEKLKRTNEQLATTNQALRQTQQELLRATEEKYRLQLAEEAVRAAALLEGQEEERRRFARELHDGIGQMLTGLKLHAEKLKQVPYADEKQQRRFNELCELIQETIQTTRQVAFNLMPSVLGDYGLASALQLLAEQVARASGLKVYFEAKGRVPRLTPASEIGLYRIAQEALHNAVKYAEAKEILVHLGREKQVLGLVIKDDGKGFEVKAARKKKAGMSQNGLENMRARARLIDGDFKISSKPAIGTTITVKLNIST